MIYLYSKNVRVIVDFILNIMYVIVKELGGNMRLFVGKVIDD